MSNSSKNPISNSELLKQFLEVQTNKIALEQQELELRKQELQQGFKYSEKALSAKKEIILEEVKSRGEESTKRYYFVGGVCFLFISAIVMLTIFNKESTAEKLLTILVPSIACGVGGYFFGYNKGKKSSEEISE